MNKIYLIVCAVLLVSTSVVKAQDKTYLTYSIGFPMGDLSDFIQKTSFRGMGLDYRHMTNEKVGVGINLAWNVFYEEKEHDTYTSGNATLSGKQFRYSNHVPMLLSADYYLTSGQTVIPFVGLGAGVMYTRRNTDMNLYTIRQEAWNFTLQPEIGINIQNGLSGGFTASLKYFNGFAAGDLEKDQSYLALNIGFLFGG